MKKKIPQKSKINEKAKKIVKTSAPFGISKILSKLAKATWPTPSPE